MNARATEFENAQRVLQADADAFDLVLAEPIESLECTAPVGGCHGETSRKDAENKGYPYLLRNLTVMVMSCLRRTYGQDRPLRL